MPTFIYNGGMSAGLLRPNVFDYDEYPKFVQDMLLYLRAARRISALRISKDAGFKSTSHLRMILKGERPLHLDRASRLARALGLRDKELKYFLKLVNIVIEPDSVKKSEIKNQIEHLKSIHQKRKIDAELLESLSDWKVIALFECMDTPWRSQTLEELSKALRVKSETLKTSLEILVKAGLITKTDSGWTKNVVAIESDAELQATAVRKLYRELGLEALRHIDETPPQQRDFSTLTLPLSEDGLRKLKIRIQRFRKDIAEILESDPSAEGVYQVNLQVFPLLPFRPKKS